MFSVVKDLADAFGADDEFRQNMLKRARSVAAAVPAPMDGDVEAVIDDDGRVVLRTTNYFWHLIEFGSANNPAYAPLRRAVLAAGLRLGETPK